MKGNLSNNILQVIENDYVDMRKADAKNISADDLHHFIMISKYVTYLLFNLKLNLFYFVSFKFYRLIALCSGKNELNKEIWESCKTLENQRKLRNKLN